jgi:hypothetical protein
MVVSLQVTITTTGVAQQISTAQTQVRFIDFQNNAAAAMRIGDSTVSATKGHTLAATGGDFPVHTGDVYFSYLSDWWVEGTSGQLLDVTYIT